MKKYIASIIVAILLFVSLSSVQSIGAATRGVSFVIHQDSWTEGYPIEASRIIVHGGTDIGTEPHTTMIGVGKAVPYQQARAFLVNTGQTYTVTVVVAYKKWGWGPIISLKENAQVYVGNNDYSVWIKR